MRNQKMTLGLAIIVSLSIIASCNGNTKKADKEIIQQEASVIEVSIGGMSCTGCEQTIQKSIGDLDGVKSVKASFTDGKALVEYYASVVDTQKIKSAVTNVGYTFNKFISSTESVDVK